MMLLLFVLAEFCLVIGYICKAHRWKLFISVYEEPSDSNLLNAMSIGHALNAVFPVRIGDVVRIVWSGRKLKNGFSLSLATVIAELYIDVITVGAMYFCLSIIGNGGEKLQLVAHIYMIIFVVVIPITIIAILRGKQIKKLIAKIASIFNHKIEFRILYVTYLCIASLKDIAVRINKVKFILFTIGIWAGYFTSYMALSMFFRQYGIYYTVSDVFTELFSGSTFYHVSYETLLIWVVYLLFPVIICGIISFIIHQRENEVEVYRKTLPQMNQADRLAFLQTYYMGENRENIQSYLEINRDVVVVEDASAGSNASTVVVMKNGGIFFRKYAFDEDGEKLQEQIDWIEEHQGDIPLPVISDQRNEFNYVTYDMPNYSGAIGLFRYIHTMPFEYSWEIIEKALNDIKYGLHEKNKRPADKATIEKYIESKITKNLRIINDNRYIKNLEYFSEIIVNGRKFPTLKYYSEMFEKDHLKNIFSDDFYTDIHGDLAIENIVCLSDRSDIDGADYEGKIRPQNYYFIDPNTGNVHDSPFLDYGKLLQSLHGNYEFLMMVNSVRIDENQISFMMARSETYGKLYERFRKYLIENFSTKDILSIYYHEVVHWLRLMPYKIRKNEKLAVVFYTGLLSVLEDVRMMEYGER